MRVVIAGGGVAGIEALLALRDLAGERVQLTLLAPEPDFVYRPFAVEEPFSHQPAERRALDPVVRQFGAELVQQSLASVDVDRREVQLGDGSSLSYDALVVCTGGRGRPPYRSAITFTADDEQLAIDELLGGGESDGRHLAFIVPPGVTWTLPAYELALMTRGRAERLGLSGTQISVHTPEGSPLAVFGTAPSQYVAGLLAAREIEFDGGCYVTERDGELIEIPADRKLEADAAVAMPIIEGRRVKGLPADEGGFIPIDEHARVTGVEDVYAAGDGTNFPVKQGGLATQQADAAAEHIAARVGADIEPEPFRPVLRGKLLVGEDSLNLRQGLAGGEGDGIVSLDYLWWPPHKISGRYLAPWLGGEDPRIESVLPVRPLDVEVALPSEWHSEPVALEPETPHDFQAGNERSDT